MVSLLSKRSTMSAWENIQLEWAKKTEEKKITGVLLWDLTVAFDTLDRIRILELVVCSFECSCSFMRGFIPGREKFTMSFNHPPLTKIG